MKKIGSLVGVAVLFLGITSAASGTMGTGDVSMTGEAEVEIGMTGEVEMTGDHDGTGDAMMEVEVMGDVEADADADVTTEMNMDPSFNTVLNWLHENGLTKYDNEGDFRGDDLITRGEAAKFVNQYAQLLDLEKDYNNCTFSDIEGYDYTLVPHILEACSYGLLKGSAGEFMPNGLITEAEAITVVIRTLVGFQDETGQYRWEEYYQEGSDLGLITDETLTAVAETDITRAKLGTRFYLAAQMHAEQKSDTDGDGMDEDTMEEESMEDSDETGTGNDMGTGDDEDMVADVILDLEGENYAFSETTIEVEEGDVVTINLTSIQGYHDWVVDAFDAATAKVSTGGTTSVTFVADAAGEYEYYCSVGNHRELGMTGTLIVN